jgi:hypothetical protein
MVMVEVRVETNHQPGGLPEGADNDADSSGWPPTSSTECSNKMCVATPPPPHFPLFLLGTQTNNRTQHHHHVIEHATMHVIVMRQHQGVVRTQTTVVHRRPCDTHQSNTTILLMNEKQSFESATQLGLVLDNK